MNTDLFVAGIKGIGSYKGVIYVDFARISTEMPAKEEQPQQEIAQRIFMTPEGFMEIFAGMERMMAQLIKSGVVRRQEGGGDTKNRMTADNTQPPKTIAQKETPISKLL